MPNISQKNLLTERPFHSFSFITESQAWTGHCAIVPSPPSTNTAPPWPLRNFLTCALRRKILLSLWPLAYAPGRDDY